MRPKKIILLFSMDEVELSTMAFVLANSGLKVLKASTAKEALRLFERNDVSVSLLDVGIHLFTSNDLAIRLKKIDAFPPIILLGDMLEGFIHAADAFLNKRNTSSAELIERIRVMSQRKRGPRPLSIRRKVIAA